MESITIGDIADIYSGYAFKSKDLSNDPVGIPVIKIGNLVGSEVDYSTTQFVPKQYAHNIQDKYYLKDKDILIAMTGQGSVGRVSQLRKKDPNDVLLLNQRVGRIVVDPQIADRDFIFFLLSSHYYQDCLFSAGYGSGQPNLSPDTIKKISIPCIELKQQKKISHILSMLNDKIEVNKAINQNLYEQTRSLYRHWESSSTDSRCSISDIATINPETYSPKENWEYVNYLDTSSIFSGVIGEIQTIRPSEEKLPSRARRILRQGDIVYSTVRPNQLHYGIVSNPLPNMLGSTGFAVIRSKDISIPNEIIYLALTEPAFIEQMQQIAEQSVSTFPSIKPSDLDACTIPRTIGDNIELMESIKTCFAIASKNDKENKQLALLRDTLLPKLMSGEVDVSEIDL